EWHARFARCSCGLHLTTPGVHSGQPDGRQRQRQLQLLPEQCRREVYLRDISHDPLAQRYLLEVSDIAAERYFSIGAAVDVLKQEVRQATASEFPIARNAGGLHERASAWPASHRHRSRWALRSISIGSIRVSAPAGL